MGDLEQLGGSVDRCSIISAKPAQQTTAREPSHVEYLIDRQRHPTVMVAMLGHHGHSALDDEVAVLRLHEAGEE